jgi:hypothetical protein
VVVGGRDVAARPDAAAYEAALRTLW